VVVEDEVVIRAMMSVTLSSDHRLVDGALAARFLARFKSILEEPLELLISP
ncbi:MAG TPA: 2-oxo acid dehydrogenase subunit E2, partial [Candidatus Latescibacteria bacterium]|nr:2-oxo acid dehydrogenase subunit E2 [Candidatus Latescibacterota bacterium]